MPTSTKQANAAVTQKVRLISNVICRPNAYGSTIDARINAAIHPTFRPRNRQPIHPVSQMTPAKANAEGNRAVHSVTPNNRYPTAEIQ